MHEQKKGRSSYNKRPREKGGKNCSGKPSSQVLAEVPKFKCKDQRESKGGKTIQEPDALKGSRLLQIFKEFDLATIVPVT